MKKFFFTLVILLILGGAGFFFGWAQFAVPPGSYGVITSKTHGVDASLVRPGEFRWIWYKLIPTNVKTTVFRLEPANFNMDFNSFLPSGDTYASFSDIDADFSWELRAIISFSINPDSLVSVVSRSNLKDQAALDAYIKNISQNIEVLILNAFTSLEENTSRLENLLSGKQDQELALEITNRFPEIQDFTLNVQSAKFPDFELYEQVRLLYRDFLAKQREIVSSGFAEKAESHIAAQLRLDELEHYGDLLTRFPVLLDYLKLESGIIQP